MSDLSQQAHFDALNNMYKAAPINTQLPPTMGLQQAQAQISMAVDPNYFHTAGAMHGSLYFKLLDDAAFFAANSLEQEYFVVTTSFTTYITRPVSSGTVRAVGKVVNFNKSQFIAEAVMYDDQDREIARGSGIFVRSKVKLADIPQYRP